MKALSVKQPYTSLIAEGIKTIETRTWSTGYRGDLLICSSKKNIPYTEDIWESFWQLYPGRNPTVGKALCIVELVNVRPMTHEDSRKALCDYYDAYSWVLSNPRKIIPFYVKGKLGLFNVDYDANNVTTRINNEEHPKQACSIKQACSMCNGFGMLQKLTNPNEFIECGFCNGDGKA